MPDKTNSNRNLLTYMRALFNDWLTAICGALSVPFGAIALWWAQSASVKLLWGCLAMLAILAAGYRAWSKERKEHAKELGELELRMNAVVDELQRKTDAKIDVLKSELTNLKRKPYDEQLCRQAEALLARLSADGKALLRHLLTNEPIEVGRRFRNEIAQNTQDAQMSIACESGIVRHNEVWLASGRLQRTDYVLNPQFRPVLQDLLYPRE